MQWFDFAFEVKAIEETGVFEGYASTFGNRDEGGDIVAAGAFAKSLKSRGPKKIKMLLDHDPKQRVGVWDEMREDDRGLYVRGRLLTETSKGKDAYIELKSGALEGLSIGGRTVADAMDGRKRARIIKEFDLYEVSLVTFPMNTQAGVSSVKSLDVETVRAIEHDLRKELNLSSASAVSAVAIVKKHLREGGEINPADLSREADVAAIAELTARFQRISG